MSVDINQSRSGLPMRHKLNDGLHARRSHRSAINRLLATHFSTGTGAYPVHEQATNPSLAVGAKPAQRTAQSAANDANRGAQPPPKSLTG